MMLEPLPQKVSSDIYLNDEEKKSLEDNADTRFAEIKTLCEFIIKNARNAEAKEIAQSCKNMHQAKILDKIHNLNLNSNDLDKLPPQLKLLRNLLRLDLVANKLTDLPEEIADLNNLQVISLEGNQFKNVPSVFITNKPKNLTEIYLANNPIEYLPLSLKEVIQEPYPYYKKWIKPELDKKIYEVIKDGVIIPFSDKTNPAS